MSDTARLFQPYILNNGVQIKNRLAVAPMTHWASDRQGQITDEERRFLQGRAQDFGLFITAATLVSEEGKAFDGEPHAISESDLGSLKEVARIIQSQGAKAILQIHHGGKLAVAELLGNRDKVAPSDDTENAARALTAQEIDKLVVAFGYAAELAILAGFDGVEIHGANGYLIQQFYSGHSNRRTDKWGADRLSFPLAVVDAVVAAKAKHRRADFIIGYRFSPEEPEEQGITMEDTFRLVDALVQKPLQYLHVSLLDFFVHARRGADTNRTRIEQIHERIGGKLPLIGVGGLMCAEQVGKAFDTGAVEFVGVARTVLLNPNFATLLKNGDGDKIETELDPVQKDKYRYPEKLWQRNMMNLGFLPPLKK